MKLAAVLAATVILAACGTAAGPAQSTKGTVPASATAASSSPSNSPGPVPAVALVDWDQDGAGYTVSLVASTGKALASVHATWSFGGKCGPVEAGIISPPPVGTSDSRVYYLDAGGLKWLKDDGSKGTAFASLAPRSSVALSFAVAPDDSAFVLNTIDYSATPLSQDITITPMGASREGASIYSARSPSTTPSAAVWPVGWHGTDLVLAYHRSTCTQGSGPGLGDPTSYHIIDATTAARKVTIGTDSGETCGLVGFPSPAGIPCAHYLGGSTQILTWTGSSGPVFGGSFPGGLSLSGAAYVGTVQSGDSSSMSLIRAAGNASVISGNTGAVMWIDDDHFLIGPFAGPGASAQSQDRVYDAATLESTTVSARGAPIARIPASFGG